MPRISFCFFMTLTILSGTSCKKPESESGIYVTPGSATAEKTDSTSCESDASSFALSTTDPLASLPVVPVSPNQLNEPEIEIGEKTYSDVYSSSTIQCLTDPRAHMCIFQLSETSKAENRFPKQNPEAGERWFTMTQPFMETPPVQDLREQIVTFRMKQCVSLEHSAEAQPGSSLTGMDVYLIRRAFNGTASRVETRQKLSELSQSIRNQRWTLQYYVCNGKASDPEAGDQIRRVKNALSCKGDDQGKCEQIRKNIYDIYRIDNVFCPRLVRDAVGLFAGEFEAQECRNTRGMSTEKMARCDEMGVASGILGNIPLSDKEFFICHSQHKDEYIEQLQQLSDQDVEEARTEELQRQKEARSTQQNLMLTAGSDCASPVTNNQTHLSLNASGNEQPSEGYVVNGRIQTEEETREMEEFFREQEAEDQYDPSPKKILGATVGQWIFFGIGLTAIAYGIKETKMIDMLENFVNGEDLRAKASGEAKKITNSNKKLEAAYNDIRLKLAKNEGLSLRDISPFMDALREESLNRAVARNLDSTTKENLEELLSTNKAFNKELPELGDKYSSDQVKKVLNNLTGHAFLSGEEFDESKITFGNSKLSKSLENDIISADDPNSKTKSPSKLKGFAAMGAGVLSFMIAGQLGLAESTSKYVTSDFNKNMKIFSDNYDEIMKKKLQFKSKLIE